MDKKNCSDQFVIDIAAIINKDELDNLQKKIIEKIGIMVEQWNYYNKIWIYLLSAADICAEKIIK